MIYTAKAHALLMDRSFARQISRYLKGQGIVTQVNHVSPNPVKDADIFDIFIYHPTVLDAICEKFQLDKKKFKVTEV